MRELQQQEDQRATASHAELGRDPGRRSLTDQLRRPEDDAVGGAGSGGVALPEGLRQRLGDATGHELGGVRLHTGSDSAVAADRLGAHAFAVGQDIHFGAGEYRPESRAGQHLIAHEVAHTVQQRGGDAGRAQPQLRVSTPGDSHEVEAEAFATSFSAGGPPTALSAGGATIQRDHKALKEFIPQLSSAPGHGRIKIDERHKQKLEVVNRRDAPSGTDFHWGGGLEQNNGAVEFVDIHSATSPRAKMEVRGRKPGDDVITSVLAHQVPGGPKVRTPTTPAPITVERPTVELAAKKRTGKSKQDDQTRMMVGDKVVLTFRFGNLDNPEKSYDGSALLGDGFGSVVTKDKADWSGGDYLVTMKAREVGIAELRLRATFGEMSDDDAVEQVVVLRVEMGQRDFLDQTIESTAMIEHARIKAEAWVESYTRAYVIAWAAQGVVLAAHGQSGRAGDDPATYEHQTRQHMNEMLGRAAERNEAWVHGANSDAKFSKHFDPVVEMKEKLTSEDGDIRSLQPVDVATEAVQIERALWRLWVKQYGRGATHDASGGLSAFGTAIETRGYKLH